MKKRLPFFLGVLLGPIGVLLSCWLFGRDAFLESVKGVGVGCCVAFVFVLLNTEKTSTAAADVSEKANMTQKCPETQPARRTDAESVPIAKTAPQPHVVAQGANRSADDASERLVRETMDKLQRLRVQIIAWKAGNGGKYPDSLAAFLEYHEKGVYPPLRDAWGRRFIYECDGAQFALASAGHDREFDTDDDLVVYSDESQGEDEVR